MSSKIKNATLTSAHTLSKADGTKLYMELKQKVVEAGILKRSYGYYIYAMSFALIGFLFSAYELYVQKNIPQIFLWGSIFAFFSVQFGGLLHDAGHRAIFKSVKFNDIFGILFGSFIIIGFNQWRTKHNAHHAKPNEEEGDPDLELPILALTEERFMAKKGIAKFLSRYQAYIYYPLGTLVSFSTRIGGIVYYTKHFNKKLLPEILFFSLGFFAWFFLPFFLFSFWKALLILVIVNGVGGFYMINIFAPNHKGMPQLRKNTPISFMEQQIITARNITPNFFTDLVYMGLNYQIEHHLFPSCPRNKLKLITPYVLAICRKYKLDYTEVGVIESNKIILSELHQISQLSRK